MKITRKARLFIEMLCLAERALKELSDEEIQDRFGSGGYEEIKNYLSCALGMYERDELK